MGKVKTVDIPKLGGVQIRHLFTDDGVPVYAASGDRVGSVRENWFIEFAIVGNTLDFGTRSVSLADSRGDTVKAALRSAFKGGK